MHTFGPSRGRVFFEVLCALGIAGSLAGGWIQTGASALLPAAAIAALYGLVHAFGLARRNPAVAVAGPALELKADDQLPPEPETTPAGKARKTKAPRKPRARRKAAAEKPVADAVPPRKGEISWVGEPEEEEVALAEFSGEMPHIPLVPLFEPEPFVRQQRTVFGRKAG